MTGSGTRTASFTVTDARYVGSKISTDLRLLHTLYGTPTLTHIDDFAEEAALLLRDGYLDTVDFGFKDTGDNAWRLRLRYTATVGGHLTDSRPGSLPTAVAITGATFSSHLTYSTAFHLLTDPQQTAVTAPLPITRTGGEEPSAAWGSSTGGHGYARGGAGVSRDVYTSY